MTSFAALWDSLTAMNNIQRGIALTLVVLAVVGYTVDRRVNKLQKGEDQKKESETTEANKQRDLLISENNRQTEEAKLEGARANERAAKAELELEKIKRPRSITPDQRAKFLDLAKGATGAKVEVCVSNNSAEAGRFARAILELMIEAKFDAKGVNGFPSGADGIALMVQNVDALPPGAEVIRKAFTATFPNVRLSEQAPRGDTVFVLIGDKPVE